MHHKHTGLGVLLALMTWGSMGLLASDEHGSLLSRVLETKTTEVPWRIITAEEVTAGIAVPTNSNVVFTLPWAISPSEVITRQSLLGTESSTIRYWGYCLPPNKAALEIKKDTLPGKMFLSEAEQAARLKEWRTKLPQFNAFNPPPSQAAAALQNVKPPKGVIRNEKTVFYPGETCYITVGGKTTLNIGVDLDGDGLNSALERAFRTDPENADTDADGIQDGVEVLRGNTNPFVTDTDGDGIHDGTEDRDRDGRRDPGETNPLKKDTDGDKLCDGLCDFGSYQTICGTGSGATCIEARATWAAGEDKNLNGTLDDGETDPLNAFSDGTHHDLELYLDCRFEGGTDC